jgi:chlorophyllase
MPRWSGPVIAWHIKKGHRIARSPGGRRRELPQVDLQAMGLDGIDGRGAADHRPSRVARRRRGGQGGQGEKRADHEESWNMPNRHQFSSASASDSGVLASIRRSTESTNKKELSSTSDDPMLTRHRLGSILLALLTALTLFGCVEVPSVCEDTAMPADCGSPAAAGGDVYQGSTGDPYQRGPLETAVIVVAPCERDSPVALRVHAPTAPATYPVVVFQHGFMGYSFTYDGILDHLASHGFVVVAPQMYSPGLAVLLGDPTSTEEATLTAALLDWLPCRLAELVGVGVDATRVGIAGHSRGGKVAWIVIKQDASRAQAIAGIDPVDGTGGPFGTEERVVQGPFDYPAPTLVLGAGAAGACAPDGDNHVQFYAASPSPAWHVVATEAGHGDMLDEPWAAVSGVVCPPGEDRDGMRRLTAGLMTAFFRGALLGDASAYATLTDVAAAPIPVTVENK